MYDSWLRFQDSGCIGVHAGVVVEDSGFRV